MRTHLVIHLCCHCEEQRDEAVSPCASRLPRRHRGLLAMTLTLSLRGATRRSSLVVPAEIAASAYGLLAMTLTLSLRGAARRSSLVVPAEIAASASRPPRNDRSRGIDRLRAADARYSRTGVSAPRKSAPPTGNRDRHLKVAPTTVNRFGRRPLPRPMGCSWLLPPSR